jgi:hypothetical protein
MQGELGTRPAYRIRTRASGAALLEPGGRDLFRAAVAASREHLRPWMGWAEREPEPLDATVEQLRQFRAHFDLGEDFAYGVPCKRRRTSGQRCLASPRGGTSP